MNPIRSCVVAAMIAASLSPVEAGAACSSYAPITDAALVNISDGVVEGYYENGTVFEVRFSSVSSGNAYTCRAVRSYNLNDAADQEKLNERIRRAAVLSLTLGYEFWGFISDQNGVSRLMDAGVSK